MNATSSAAHPESAAAAAWTEFRTPLGPRLFSLLGVVILGVVSALMTALTVVVLTNYLAIGLLVMAPAACLLAGLTGYVLRDLRGKWGLRVVMTPDTLTLDLPGGRSLIHRPPERHVTMPFADIEAIETRLEAYPSLGMEIMQRAYVLRRKSGELIFLFEDRALGTAYESSVYPKLAADIAERAGVPMRDLGMVEGGGGVLAVWGTRAQDWSAPTLPLAQQFRIWRHVALTGTLSIAIVIVALVVRLMSGPL